MRTLIVIFTATTLLAAGSLWSQETDPARQIAEAWQAEQQLRADREQRLNELMTTLSEEMQAIHMTSDRDKQQQLLTAHRANMHEAMALMRDLGGKHMRDLTSEHLTSARGHMMPSHSRDHMSDAIRLNDLETRVDMMQIMLESMLTEDAGS
jgi:hypothetical protein